MGPGCNLFLTVMLAAGPIPQQTPAPAKAVTAPRTWVAPPPSGPQSPVPAVAASAPHAPAQPRLGPFRTARLAPADATVFLHVERAGRLRRDLAPRPIARSIDSIVGGGAFGRSWIALAQSLKLDEGALFDVCFGREFTYIGRGDGSWAVVTEFGSDGEERVREMLRALQVRVREPRFSLAVSELPEQDVLIASDGGQVVIGPTKQPQAFYAVLQRWGGAPDGDQKIPVLATDAQFLQRLGELKCDALRADVAAFVRHERPLGGCSMIVADVRGDDVEIKHAARFDNPLLAAPVTKLKCDFSPLGLVSKSALVAIMQPRDVGDGPMETFLSASLGVGLISPDMRSNLADRRMLIMGEADARQLPEARDILTTTFVACLEAKDGTQAGPQLDAQMSRLTKRLNDLGQGAFLIRMPDTAALRTSEARQADLGGAGQWFTGGFPVMKAVSLNWTVAQGPEGAAWYLVGSNPQALQEAVAALGQPCERDERMVGQFDSCGLANGQRLGRHLQSWSDEAAEFTDPQHVEQVRQTLRTFANLAAGIQDCRWQMARPTANTMRLEVQMKLAPAVTAEN